MGAMWKPWKALICCSPTALGFLGLFAWNYASFRYAHLSHTAIRIMNNGEPLRLADFSCGHHPRIRAAKAFQERQLRHIRIGEQLNQLSIASSRQLHCGVDG